MKMTKEEREEMINTQFLSTKMLIETGKITSFNQIFKSLKRSYLAEKIGIRYPTFKYRIEGRLSEFKMKEFFAIAHAIGVERRTIINLAMTEIEKKSTGK
jgi:hypothetical protein